MLIARTSPYLVFYHPGYCRLTLKPYSLNLDTLDDPTIHLTNAAIQKQDPLYYDNKEFQIQLVPAVADLIEHSKVGDKDKNKASADYLRLKVDHEIKKCMTDILKVSITVGQRYFCIYMYMCIYTFYIVMHVCV